MKKLDVDKAVELWTTGTAIKVIATRLGTTEKTLQKFMKGNEDYFPARKKKVKKSLTAAQMEFAAQMWADGYSLRAIGDKIGKTKNAVSGIMGRNRDIFPEKFGELQKRNVSSTSSGKPKKSNGEAAKEARRKRTANEVRNIFHEALKPTEPVHKPKENALAYDEARLPYAVTFIDLDDRACCKWPITSFEKGRPNLFCGEVKSKGNYCAGHNARQYRTVQYEEMR